MTVIKAYKNLQIVPNKAKLIYVQEIKGSPYFDGQMNEKRDTEVIFYYEVQMSSDDYHTEVTQYQNNKQQSK